MTDGRGGLTAVIRFPGAEYTQRAVLAAAQRRLPGRSTAFVTDIESGEAAEKLCGEDEARTIVFFSDYDLLPFDALLRSPDRILGSSYCIRKALIRKHYLAHSLHAYRLKQSDPERARPVTPKTWHFDINYADELDELLMDDLYDLREELEANEDRDAEERKWFILKPAMADRGNGIRLFASLKQLQAIFEEFEGVESDDEAEEDVEGADESSRLPDDASTVQRGTMVSTSQLRHFVVQEYIASPLLLRAPRPASPDAPPRKFHLRAYVLCVGALKVYLADEMLALFAPLEYTPPGQGTADGDDAFASDDLRRHLTNTCLQTKDQPAGSTVSEENVFLFSELAGMQIASPHGAADANPAASRELSSDDLAQIKQSVVDVLATTFTACATAGSVHWQMWPNSFEVFGIDLLVEQRADSPTSGFRAWLLEINAQPDFAQTGSRLEPTIEHLFSRVFDLAVLPFFSDGSADKDHKPDSINQSEDGMTLCLDLRLSNAWN